MEFVFVAWLALAIENFRSSDATPRATVWFVTGTFLAATLSGVKGVSLQNWGKQVGLSGWAELSMIVFSLESPRDGVATNNEKNKGRKKQEVVLRRHG